MDKLKEVQLAFDDNGEIVEKPLHDETLEAEKIDYENLSKADLIRLCKEKDNSIKSYETERNNMTESFNNEIKNMNDYYIKRLKERDALIRYYERKFGLIKSLIDIEQDKEEKKNDTV